MSATVPVSREANAAGDCAARADRLAPAAGGDLDVTLPADLPLHAFRPLALTSEQRCAECRHDRKDRKLGARWAAFWLRAFFWLTEHWPRFMARARPVFCGAAFWFSSSIRKGTRANARRLLGPTAGNRERDRLARQMIGSFYQFCCEMGQTIHASPEELLGRVEEIRGHRFFEQAKARGRGMIVVTAHLGSFEVGLALLAALASRTHVVFRRDAMQQFERWRSALRARLGVHEAALDEGWTIWMRLRDALARNEAVVMQGDRTMPGQKGQAVPVLDGHIELPSGPVKLAMVSGATILPVFTARMPDGRIRFHIEEPIDASGMEEMVGQPHPALTRLGKLIEEYLRMYPEQWLMLQPAWVEDQPSMIHGEGEK